MGHAKTRFPLGTKIALGLAFNVGLLGLGLAVVLVIQVRLNPGWLFAGRTGERLQAAARLLVGDLAFTPPDRLESVLDKYRDAYQMDFRLFDNGGQVLAGPTDSPPPEVSRLIVRRGPQPGRGPRGQAAASGMRPNPDQPRGPRGLAGRSATELFPRHVLRTGVPAAYWVVIHLPMVGEYRPLTLVMRTDSLWSGALLLDLQPWLLAAAGALALSGVFWFPLLRGIARDIGRMMRGTEAIAAGRFETRLELDRSDELGRLADAIDRMAGRLAGFVDGQKRFLGDAAHELCSPISRMQAAVALLESRPAAVTGTYLADLREDLDEMSTLVAELLAFSRATHGRSVHLEAVSLRGIAVKACTREGIDPGRFLIEIPESLAAIADPRLLERALANLVRNAVRHAGESGPVTLSAVVEGSTVSLTVADEGPGVPEHALSRLFEPFFRLEPARDRESGGVGLGLAIVKTCVDACRGTVAARNRKPRGFEVTLVLPKAAPTDAEISKPPPSAS